MGPGRHGGDSVGEDWEESQASCRGALVKPGHFLMNHAGEGELNGEKEGVGEKEL